MRIVILGLSITSSWGNGHATTYRALVKGLAARGHDVLFLERDVPWYRMNRDLPAPPGCRTVLYADLDRLQRDHARAIRTADLVIVGSFVPDGIAVGDFVLEDATGVTAFYDIDTPVTLARLADGVEYLAPAQIRAYDLYLSFTGGPTLDVLRDRYGANAPRALYCSVDLDSYYPEPRAREAYDLGYLGTYSEDRQAGVDRLLLQPAQRWAEGRFLVAGAQYPAGTRWPANVDHVDHVPPGRHRAFYNSLRYALNVTRRDMVAAGYSPSVRLFEAAACGTPIVSDSWAGIEQFFTPAREILLANDAEHALKYLLDVPEHDRREVARRARERVRREHSAERRAAQLEHYVGEMAGSTEVVASLTERPAS
jgi:spore maturation protein CgeB